MVVGRRLCQRVVTPSSWKCSDGNPGLVYFRGPLLHELVDSSSCIRFFKYAHSKGARAVAPSPNMCSL
ncbi:unnamed protein product [Amoebophrya sp. A25]|nr:unnamed protein product [Amoebophrya sp. A25]|eukprot:GSA25T00011253001.1